MKRILVLTPLNERLIYPCSAILKALSKINPLLASETFMEPMFADYLCQTQKASHNEPIWESKALFSIYVGNKLASVADEDLIIFGLVNKKYKFDHILSFNDGLAYTETDMWSKHKNVFEDEKFVDLSRDKLYTIEDSKLNLSNDYAADAQLLNDLINADNSLKLDYLENYKKKLKGE